MTAQSRQRRCTILKPLPADCLLEGQLHPSIRQRLARVRELPMTGVATLHGVERDGSKAQLVWEYVDGLPLADHLASLPAGEERDREAARVLDELGRTVHAMHGFGIVHGAVHERNVIVDTSGAVKLTHVSPLLYYDTDVDLSAIRAMRDNSFGHRIDTTAPDSDNAAHRRDRNRPRWRPAVLVAAAAVAACGLAAVFSLVRYVDAQQPQPIDPPVARSPR